MPRSLIEIICTILFVVILLTSGATATTGETHADIDLCVVVGPIDIGCDENQNDRDNHEDSEGDQDAREDTPDGDLDNHEDRGDEDQSEDGATKDSRSPTPTETVPNTPTDIETVTQTGTPTDTTTTTPTSVPTETVIETPTEINTPEQSDGSPTDGGQPPVDDETRTEPPTKSPVPTTVPTTSIDIITVEPDNPTDTQTQVARDQGGVSLTTDETPIRDFTSPSETDTATTVPTPIERQSVPTPQTNTEPRETTQQSVQSSPTGIAQTNSEVTQTVRAASQTDTATNSRVRVTPTRGISPTDETTVVDETQSDDSFLFESQTTVSTLQQTIVMGTVTDTERTTEPRERDTITVRHSQPTVYHTPSSSDVNASVGDMFDPVVGSSDLTQSSTIPFTALGMLSGGCIAVIVLVYRRRLIHWIAELLGTLKWIVGAVVLRDEDPLSASCHEISSLIANNPGITVTELTERVDLSESGVRHCAGQLTQAGLIIDEKRYGSRRYFTSDFSNADIKRAIQNMPDTERNVLALLEQTETTLMNTEIAEQIGKSESRVSRAVRTLSKNDLIEYHTVGRTNQISLTMEVINEFES